MENLILEVNQLKDGSKLTLLDTTITGLVYLGDKPCTFVCGQSHGKAAPLFKKLFSIKTLQESHLHGLRFIACLVVPTELKAKDSKEEAELRNESKGVASGLIWTPPSCIHREKHRLLGKRFRPLPETQGLDQSFLHDEGRPPHGWW